MSTRTIGILDENDRNDDTVQPPDTRWKVFEIYLHGVSARECVRSRRGRSGS